MNAGPRRASWWRAVEKDGARCFLCPRGCLISEGRRGFCQVRGNRNGVLYADAYGRPAALQIDPIEKKPLAYFLPGTWTFSIGTVGCNLNCAFCQNAHLSRGALRAEADAGDRISPEQIVAKAVETRCASVAFTYNEPTIWAEYAMDIARAARAAGLKTVLVSNGYITPEAAADFYPLIDAANIDMKGFSETFYETMCGGRLAPVLGALAYFFGLPEKHLEITNLIIPGKNDAPEMIDAFLDWVETRLDKRVPLHFTAYHPAHRYRESPPTPPETLYRIRALARSRGFERVCLGNI